MTNLENARILTTTEMVYSIMTTLIVQVQQFVVNEENNTNHGSTEDVYSEFDDHKIVNLTNGIISSGYFDEADCNFVLFAKDWDENSYIMKQKLLDASQGILSIIEYGLLLTRMWVTTSYCQHYTIGEMAQLIQLIR